MNGLKTMNIEKYEQPDAEAAIKCYKKQSQRAMNSIQQTIQAKFTALNDDKYSDEFKEALDEDIEEVEKEMYF